MGTGLIAEDLIQRMDECMNKVLNNLKSWDGTLEFGIKILEYNEIHFDELKTLNLHLKDKSFTYNEEYLQKINEIMNEHKSITIGLKIEQERLVLLMEQLSKRDDVIKSYISVKKDPIFIDKDIN